MWFWIMVAESWLDSLIPDLIGLWRNTEVCKNKNVLILRFGILESWDFNSVSIKDSTWFLEPIGILSDPSLILATSQWLHGKEVSTLVSCHHYSRCACLTKIKHSNTSWASKKAFFLLICLICMPLCIASYISGRTLMPTYVITILLVC